MEEKFNIYVLLGGLVFVSCGIFGIYIFCRNRFTFNDLGLVSSKFSNIRFERVREEKGGLVLNVFLKENIEDKEVCLSCMNLDQLMNLCYWLSFYNNFEAAESHGLSRKLRRLELDSLSYEPFKKVLSSDFLWNHIRDVRSQSAVVSKGDNNVIIGLFDKYSTFLAHHFIEEFEREYLNAYSVVDELVSFIFDNDSLFMCVIIFILCIFIEKRKLKKLIGKFKDKKKKI